MKTEISLTETAAAFTKLRGFLGLGQLHTLAENCKRSEERQFFRAKMCEMAALIEAMPKTYEQDGKGDAAIVTLHYFTGGCDFYITEKDAGSPDDAPEQFQSQAFGLADLGYGPELGYISLPEILDAGAELDLYFTPRTLGSVRMKQAA